MTNKHNILTHNHIHRLLVLFLGREPMQCSVRISLIAAADASMSYDYEGINRTP